MTFTVGTDDPSPNEDIQELLAEVERLQAGNFTKEEIHNICHNLHNTVSLEEFAAGCKAEQIRLYGTSDPPSLKVEMSAPAVFVFGSNLAGRHGAGAALFARNYNGAIYGQGVGPQGQSYAIPTKDALLQTLPLILIKTYILGFLEYAKANPALTFYVTRIGCGLAGYKDEDIAPMFKSHPSNCTMPVEWEPWLS
jgi:hypothetical protein